jgi:hypothetical protein
MQLGQSCRSWHGSGSDDSVMVAPCKASSNFETLLTVQGYKNQGKSRVDLNKNLVYFLCSHGFISDDNIKNEQYKK